MHWDSRAGINLYSDKKSHKENSLTIKLNAQFSNVLYLLTFHIQMPDFKIPALDFLRIVIWFYLEAVDWDRTRLLFLTGSPIPNLKPSGRNGSGLGLCWTCFCCCCCCCCSRDPALEREEEELSMGSLPKKYRMYFTESSGKYSKIWVGPFVCLVCSLCLKIKKTSDKEFISNCSSN